MKTSGRNQESFGMPPQWFEVILKIIDERISAQYATKEDFSELKAVVAELAQAQKRTENDLIALKVVVAELAQAQKRTEITLERLGDRVDKLAITVDKLGDRVDKLTNGFKTLKSEVGGLSDNLGYSLENKAIKNLPGILAKEGFTIKEELQRKYLKVNGSIIEVNIIGKVCKGDEEFLLLGESASRFRERKIKKFVQNCEAIGGNQFRILIGHILPPPFEPLLKEFNIRFIPSFQVE